MERTLAEPTVKRHTEIRQILLERRKLLAIGNVLEKLKALLLGHGKIFISLTIDDALRSLHDIRTMVAVLGELHRLAEEFQIARIY